MDNEKEKGISFPNISIQEFMAAGSDAFAEQLNKMVKDKIIAPYGLVEMYRFVLDLYKSSLSGNKPDEKTLTEAQNKLNFAIDHAKVNNLPFEEFEALKKDVDYLKYNILL
jgi:hypothetical protein